MAIDDPALSLRPATDADMPFLFQLYASTRIDEVRSTGWTMEQITQFINQQFWAQHTAYHTNAPHADYDVVLRHGQAIGRLYVDRRAHEIELMEITLLPDYRRQGIGSTLLRALQAEGAQTQKPVRLYVEDFNPAYRLYTRFGFQPIGSHGLYTYMEWQHSELSQVDPHE